MKTMSETTLRRKYLMFDQDDFDEVINNINNKQREDIDGDFGNFIDYFTSISELMTIHDLREPTGRAVFFMSVLNLCMNGMGDEDKTITYDDVDNIIDVINAICVHLSIVQAFVADKEGYHEYILNRAPNVLKSGLDE